MRLHHVGITFKAGVLALEKLVRLDALFGFMQQDGERFVIEEWKCKCFPFGMIEFIQLDEGSPLLKYHEAYIDWNKTLAPFVLHHIAFEVEDFDGMVAKAKKLCRVVGEGQMGYMGKRIAFIHPEYFGILIEVVEA